MKSQGHAMAYSIMNDVLHLKETTYVAKQPTLHLVLPHEKRLLGIRTRRPTYQLCKEVLNESTPPTY